MDNLSFHAFTALEPSLMKYLKSQMERAELLEDEDDSEDSEMDQENEDKGLKMKYTKILSIISRYVDYHAVDPFELDSQQYRKTFLLHIVNHILNLRLQIRENNKNGKSEQLNGYTRARALILAPYRVDALLIVEELRNILKYAGITNIEGLEKFEEKFGD